MSWLIRRNGRAFPAPCGDQARHKEGAAGAAGGEPGGEGRTGGTPASAGHEGGFTGFGSDRDIFGGTNPALMGSSEAAVTPKGYGSSAAKASRGETLTLAEKIAAMAEKSLVGGIGMGVPGAALAMGAAGKSAAKAGGGAFPGAESGGPNPAGAGGVGDAGRGGGAATAGGAGGAPSGAVSPGLAPPTSRPAAVLAQHLAAQDPSQLAVALGGDAEEAIASAKELAMRLKLFQHALARASQASQRAG